MLRCTQRLLQPARCHYDVLGVAATATVEELRRAFRDKAKATHPDSGERNQAHVFRQLVDSYRVLRCPTQRKEYDMERASGAAPSRRGYGPHHYTGRSQRMHEAHSTSSGTVAAPMSRTPAEYYAIGIALLGGAWLLANEATSTPASRDRDRYPQALPKVVHSGRSNGTTAIVSEPAARRDATTEAGASSSVAMDIHETSNRSMPQMSSSAMLPEVSSDRAVRAFYDPFFQSWHRIPEGYEAPNGTDLTAWHHKRVDPVEWSKLFAEGKLHQMIPRGGVEVRFVPQWETHEPILLGDPQTGKTVVADSRLPPRAHIAKDKCEVQF